MKQVKVLYPDTKCCVCEHSVNRKRAEAADWTEILYVDHTGMPLSRAYICNHCEEDGWHPDKFEGKNE